MPIFYSSELFDRICARIADGETLRSICRDLDMPSYAAVYDWIQQRPDCATRFARAREVGYDAIAEDALRIADTPVEGLEMTTETGPDGEKVKLTKKDMLKHRKLQVYTRLQLLEKWYPQRYGRQQQLDVTINQSLADRLARAQEKVNAEYAAHNDD